MTENTEKAERRVDFEAPPNLSCPECGTTEHGVDGEGRCECKNGHFFWDTNSWEWKTLYRARTAERQIELLKEEVDKLRWKLHFYEQTISD